MALLNLMNTVAGPSLYVGAQWHRIPFGLEATGETGCRGIISPAGSEAPGSGEAHRHPPDDQSGIFPAQAGKIKT